MVLAASSSALTLSRLEAVRRLTAVSTSPTTTVVTAGVTNHVNHWETAAVTPFTCALPCPPAKDDAVHLPSLPTL
jgi:hypothetical protein